MKINEATTAFIREHQDDNPRELALRGCKLPDVDFHMAIQQIQGRQKAQSKLPDFYANEQIWYPATVSLEQCSSSATAEYKASLIEGSTFVDFSGGFGVDTFAFAKKFKLCQYVEFQPELCQIAEHNAAILNIHNIQFHCGNMEEMLPQMEPVNTIYLDPSRRDEHGNRVISIEQCSPNISILKDSLLEKANRIMVKLSPMIDLKQTIRTLPEVESAHIVSVNGECKEILLLMTKGDHTNRTFVAADIRSDKTHTFSFTENEELTATPQLAVHLQKYLLEPNASVLKAGAFKTIATRFGLQKLHPHSHLYLSTTPIEDFPGRIFEIIDCFVPNKKAIKEHLKDIRQANVSIRNFPLTAESLKQKLKLSDGGDIYLFGTTWHNDERIILVSRKC
ncbi:MAG: SAM-dependent methyltransferase [Bacteroidales bacterium]|nr:SAM-dependent methyltransferase [Bacteroidales bacterium]